MSLSNNTVFGFIKPEIDVHTMGISNMANLLRRCGYKVVIASSGVMRAAESIDKLNNIGLICNWIKDNNISVLSYSYRLDPNDGKDLFCKFYHQLLYSRMFKKEGGLISKISFAGLPKTCELIQHEINDDVIYFPGDETQLDSLVKYDIDIADLPSSVTQIHEYDRSLLSFGNEIISSEVYKKIPMPDHYGYRDCGTDKDSFVKRLSYCREKGSLPIIRVHAGPYSPNRYEAIKEFLSWTKDLAYSHLLDVLSIGSSQLTQQHFGEEWDGLSNGGGVPVNSELEYRMIAEAAKPMLVRTYAGTNNVPWMAQMHERTLNISWHALSFWWFCQLDGRGDNTVVDNLKEHIEAIKFIASTGKPLEPNVPHHFSFRGGDDVTYIVSAYLAAKTAKKYGITQLILQNMLNTPKYTWGIQDVAKGRVMLRLVRSLEDEKFNVSLQTRVGLEYFSTDIEKAKIQLAAMTALMDDIEPDNIESPEIIHVVSYSEAVRLANPDIIKESIKITLSALSTYREKKALGKTFDTINNQEIQDREIALYYEAKEAIELLEKSFSNLYTPEGLYDVYRLGFFPTPFIYDPHNHFPNATKWSTSVIDGSVCVVDEDGHPIDTVRRYKQILQGLLQ